MEPPRAEPVIEGLSKTYPGGVRALQGVSLRIATGMFGLLGPNGAGQSTLMRYPPARANIELVKAWTRAKYVPSERGRASRVPYDEAAYRETIGAKDGRTGTFLVVYHPSTGAPQMPADASVHDSVRDEA